MKRVGRRSSQDKEWQAVKEEVRKRDKGDRILRVITPLEYLMLKKNAGYFLNILDPAHYIAVSDNPSLIYEKNNIVILNRFSHSNLDNFRDPITSQSITKEEAQKWWERILKGNKEQYEFLKDKGLI